MGHADAPNFLVLGGAKCGTTTLYHLLKQADDVFLPKSKEPRFFGNTAAYRRGVDRYLSEHFRGAAAYKARGEASPNYLHGGGVVAERVRLALGEELKLIVLLRDPVQRAWSHYLHMCRLGKEDLPFDQALKAEPARLAADPESWFGYFSDGLYAAQLRQWLEFYPRERFLILLTDTLKRDPRGVLNEVCAFLGVRPPDELELAVDTNAASAVRSRLLARLLNRPNDLTNTLKLALPFTFRQRVRDQINKWNRRRGEAPPPQLPAVTERRLRARYAEDLEALEAVSGYDLSHWYGREPERAGRQAPRHPGGETSGGQAEKAPASTLRE